MVFAFVWLTFEDGLRRLVRVFDGGDDDFVSWRRCVFKMAILMMVVMMTLSVQGWRHAGASKAGACSLGREYSGVSRPAHHGRLSRTTYHLPANSFS